jgi:uncharacterized protein
MRRAATAGIMVEDACRRARSEMQNNLPHVLITGGTGFIGTALTARLKDAGARVSVLTRNRQRARRHFDFPVDAFESLDELGTEDAPEVIVNLAGKNLGEERWNPEVKKAIVASRVETTRRVIDYIARAPRRPELLISGSAVGYYGARGDAALGEDSGPGSEFQSDLCRQWEAVAREAERYGVRVCISRTGVVLGPGGGMLAGLLPLFRLGLGAVAGHGGQWMSWIQMEDLIDLFIRFMLEPTLSGAFNNTAPDAVRNRDFSKKLGQAIHRPVVLRVPGIAMRMLYGEMAHLYLTGQRALPCRHIQSGWVYRHPEVSQALAASVWSRPPHSLVPPVPAASSSRLRSLAGKRRSPS